MPHSPEKGLELGPWSVVERLRCGCWAGDHRVAELDGERRVGIRALAENVEGVAAGVIDEVGAARADEPKGDARDTRERRGSGCARAHLAAEERVRPGPGRARGSGQGSS